MNLWPRKQIFILKAFTFFLKNEISVRKGKWMKSFHLKMSLCLHGDVTVPVCYMWPFEQKLPRKLSTQSAPKLFCQGSDIFPLSKLSPISHVLWIAGLCDLCYFYWHGYSICFFCSENLLYVNSQSFKKVWYQHEDRKELLMTANSVVNIVTPGIFTSDAQIIFSPIVFFLSTVNQCVGIEQCLDSDLSYLFLCFFLQFFEAAFCHLYMNDTLGLL